MKCFIIMPFRPEFNGVLQAVKAAIAEAAAGEAVRMDNVEGAGHITLDMQAELQTADFCSPTSVT